MIELRFFGGLIVEETAEALKISPQSVMRDWKLAKAWLTRELGKDGFVSAEPGSYLQGRQPRWRSSAGLPPHGGVKRHSTRHASARRMSGEVLCREHALLDKRVSRHRRFQPDRQLAQQLGLGDS